MSATTAELIAAAHEFGTLQSARRHGLADLVLALAAALEAAEAQRDTLAAAMERVKQAQPQTLERLREQGVVFDEAPRGDPMGWQSIAFWIYTDLCEVETIARSALAAVEPPEEQP